MPFEYRTKFSHHCFCIDCDPALALLSDYVTHANITMRIGAIFGLGLAYAGSDRQDLIQLLLPVFADAKVTHSSFL